MSSRGPQKGPGKKSLKRTYCAGPSVLPNRCHSASVLPDSIIERPQLGPQDHGTSPLHQYRIRRVTGRFAHFPVRPESFCPESFRPRVVSPSITWIISPSYPESFRPLFDESFRQISKFIFCWRYCDKFTVFVSFNEDFGYISLKNDMSFINWSRWYIYLYSV